MGCVGRYDFPGLAGNLCNACPGRPQFISQSAAKLSDASILHVFELRRDGEVGERREGEGIEGRDIVPHEEFLTICLGWDWEGRERAVGGCSPMSQLPKLCVKISILRHRRMWVRSFSTRLTSVTFAEDKVFIFSYSP